MTTHIALFGHIVISSSVNHVQKDDITTESEVKIDSGSSTTDEHPIKEIENRRERFLSLFSRITFNYRII